MLLPKQNWNSIVQFDGTMRSPDRAQLTAVAGVEEMEYYSHFQFTNRSYGQLLVENDLTTYNSIFIFIVFSIPQSQSILVGHYYKDVVV